MVKQRGVTLIELVVACAVMGIAFLTIADLFVTVASLNRQARNLAIVTTLAQQQIEGFRNLSYNSIPIGSTDFSSALPANLGSPKTAAATVSETVAGNLKHIDVLVTWYEGHVQKRVELDTDIAVRGVDR